MILLRVNYIHIVKNNYIRAFKVGKTIETACELTIYGFNGEKLLYEEYCKKIIENMKKEIKAA